MAALITWCASPAPEISTIEGILNDLSDDDLAHLMHFEGGQAGRIAWLEYGRRKGFADFEVGLTVTDKEIALVYESEGPGLHGLAFYLEKEDGRR